MHTIIDPLTDPAKYGGDSSDAFDVIIPSVPGYGFLDLHQAGLISGRQQICGNH